MQMCAPRVLTESIWTFILLLNYHLLSVCDEPGNWDACARKWDKPANKTTSISPLMEKARDRQKVNDENGINENCVVF